MVTGGRYTLRIVGGGRSIRSSPRPIIAMHWQKSALSKNTSWRVTRYAAVIKSCVAEIKIDPFFGVIKFSKTFGWVGGKQQQGMSIVTRSQTLCRISSKQRRKESKRKRYLDGNRGGEKFKREQNKRKEQSVHKRMNHKTIPP